MAIARKPKATKPKEGQEEKDVTALINKGGSAAKSTAAEQKEKNVLVRIPAEILDKIDNVVSSKPIKTPRHTWLLEAIFEKLEREK